MELAQRLQALRKKSDLSQEQLADMLGISRQAISKWESGQGKPELDNVIKLVDLYHVTADYILFGKESNEAVIPPPQKEVSRTTRRTIGIICIVAATAIITVLFIIALGFVGKYLLFRG